MPLQPILHHRVYSCIVIIMAFGITVILLVAVYWPMFVRPPQFCAQKEFVSEEGERLGHPHDLGKQEVFAHPEGGLVYNFVHGKERINDILWKHCLRYGRFIRIMIPVINIAMFTPMQIIGIHCVDYHVPNTVHSKPRNQQNIQRNFHESRVVSEHCVKLIRGSMFQLMISFMMNTNKVGISAYLGKLFAI